MGASIFWRPVKSGKQLSVGGRSSFISALELPRKLNEENIQFLRGLGVGNEDFRKSCEELIEAIYKHGEIEVYAEY